MLDDGATFCSSCWAEVDWLGEGCCDRCAMPLEGTEQGVCVVCEAKPGVIERTRAAVRYDDLSRTLAMKLKYGRRVGLAKAMGDAMGRLVPDGSNAILVPVPLHRSRLWKRGFNQAALLARRVGRQRDLACDVFALQRIKATAPMVSMNTRQRLDNLRGAFAVRDGNELRDKTVILVDDVRTSGATLEGCAKALKKAGAARVEAILWARVVRPRDITRS